MRLFTPGTLEFLARAPYEDRQWLADNRAVYEEQVLGPQRDLIEALSDVMRSLDPNLEGTASRIYKDMRFHRGGPPLRGNIWVTFQDRNLDPGERPAFFFELYPDRHRYGMGFYLAGSSKMDRIRRAIDANPARFASLVDGLPTDYQLMGDSYKKSRSAHLPERLRPWYDRKSFWIQVEQPNDGRVLGQGLAEHLQHEWFTCTDLYHFVRQA